MDILKGRDLCTSHDVAVDENALVRNLSIMSDSLYGSLH